MVDCMNEETKLNFLRQDWPSKRPKVVNNVMPGINYPDEGFPFGYSVGSAQVSQAEWQEQAQNNRSEGKREYRTNLERNFKSQAHGSNCSLSFTNPNYLVPGF